MCGWGAPCQAWSGARWHRHRGNKCCLRSCAAPLTTRTRGTRTKLEPFFCLFVCLFAIVSQMLCPATVAVESAVQHPASKRLCSSPPSPARSLPLPLSVSLWPCSGRRLRRADKDESTARQCHYRERLALVIAATRHHLTIHCHHCHNHNYNHKQKCRSLSSRLKQ